MALPENAVRRPIAIFMATLAVAVFGVLAAKRLPVELLPNLTYPTLTVQTEYPDAAPVSVEQFVTRPLEEAVGVIPGVRDMRSVSRAGLSEIILEFDWDEDMNLAALDVREKLGLVALPREVDPPKVLRYDPSLDPVMRLSVVGDRSLDDIRQLSERLIKPKLESVAGIAAAKVRGGLEPEIQVEGDEDRLASLGLTLEDLQNALLAENINSPGGTLKDWGAVFLVRTLHEFDSLEQVRRTVIRESAEGRVRVEDVARVTRGSKDREVITRSQGQETVEIALHREGGSNTIAVAENARVAIENLTKELGQELDLVILTDQSIYIAEAVGQVWSAAVLGGVLAILVLFFFLGDPRATGIIALTIPTSVVATFLPMHQAGVTLNIMSLGGLALGVGMLVDNSIVVLEAIDRRWRLGATRREAASKGASEVAGAVTAATLTTLCVFLPIVFVQGVAGQLFYDLAVTVCLSLLASLVVSLTLIPALAALEWRVDSSRSTLYGWDQGLSGEDNSRPWTFRLFGQTLEPIGDGVHWMSRLLTVVFFVPRLLLLLAVLVLGGAYALGSAIFRFVTYPATLGFKAVGRFYPPLLRGALRFRFFVLAMAFLILFSAVALIPRLGTELVPDLAQGEFAFRVTLPEGTPLESTADLVSRIEGPLIESGRFHAVFSVSGALPSSASGRQTTGENLAQINFVLREKDLDEVGALDQVRDVLALFGSIEAELVRPSVLSLDSPIEIEVYSDQIDSLQDASDQLVATLEAREDLVDIMSTAEAGSPEIQISLDRDRNSALGLNADQIGQTLRRQIRGEIVGEFREAEERLDIRLRSSQDDRDQASSVADLRVRLEDGSTIPISAIADVTVDRGPSAIHRSNGARVAQITAKSRDSNLGDVVSLVRDEVRAQSLPGGAVAEMAGQDEEIQVSFDSLKLALSLAIFLVFVVMAMQFESLLYPFVILLSVPLGLIGVVLALFVTGSPVGVLALIGVVMLAGIVVNNAIVLVDAINRRRRDGEALGSAIVASGAERLRPILMTTTTTVLALLPMVLGLGAGDELRAPMAVTVIGGLTVSSALTLLVIPCFYRILSRERPSRETPESRNGEASWSGGVEAPIETVSETLRS